MTKMKKEDSSVHVGNKVLPIISDLSASSSSSLSSMSMSCVDGSHHKEDKVKGNNNKTKALFKLKEMLRWAAAVKADKGGKLGRKVLHFRNKSATIKSGGLDEDSSNNDSPKISFRWELESVSTTCSAASAPPSFKYAHCSQRKGSWITTDDDFVVLEL